MFNYYATVCAAEKWMNIVPRRPLWHNAKMDWSFEPVVRHADGYLRLTLSASGKPAKTRDLPITDICDAANERGSVIAVLDDVYLKMFECCGIAAPPLPVRG